MIKQEKIDRLRAVLMKADDLLKGYIEDLEKRGASLNYGRYMRQVIAQTLSITETRKGK
jgi:hypothetical protein